MEHVISHALFLGVQPKPSRISVASPCPIPHCGGSPVDMHSTNIPSGCEECVAECDVATCDLDAGSSQCTDHCLVVPCEDLCPDVCATACIPWFDPTCEAAPLQGFQDLPSCCAEVPSQGNSLPASLSIDLLQHRQEFRIARHGDWDKTSLFREIDALICPCATQSQPHSFECDTCDPRFLSIDKSMHSRQYHSSTSHPLLEENLAPSHCQGSPFSPIMSANASARSSPDPSSMSASTCDAQVFQQFDTPEKRSSPNVRSYRTPPSENFCLWAECRQSFDSFHDLISHVNATHLHLPIPPRSLSQQASLPQPSYSPALQFYPGNIVHPSPNSVSCMWGDCNMYPSPSRIPGPSTGNVTDAALGLLASHLLQDHLGVSVSQPSSYSATRPVTHMPTSGDPQRNSPTSILSHVPNVSGQTTQSYQFPIPSVSPLSSTLNDFTQHHCKWQLCLHAHTAFSSSADLTTHITDVHVGGGKNKYNCMWEGCNRQGELGFSSKQKILRHIQSHTGHRPFRCKLCDQYFSEAATLQQHMRRHTKEKPYVCDFPGCNKAFAITGALTIHKRTHSGKKPFKCTYCDRSFSESSNLSKHVRTHTGDRPYPCSYTGCEKRFARPDQVARHMKVHNKKRNAENAGNAEAVVGDLEEADNVEEMEIEE